MEACRSNEIGQDILWYLNKATQDKTQRNTSRGLLQLMFTTSNDKESLFLAAIENLLKSEEITEYIHMFEQTPHVCYRAATLKDKIRMRRNG